MLFHYFLQSYARTYVMHQNSPLENLSAINNRISVKYTFETINGIVFTTDDSHNDIKDIISDLYPTASLLGDEDVKFPKYKIPTAKKVNNYLLLNKYIGNLIMNNIIMDNFIVRFFAKKGISDFPTRLINTTKNVSILTISKRDLLQQEFYKFFIHNTVEIYNIMDASENENLKMSELLMSLDKVGNYSEFDIFSVNIFNKKYNEILNRLFEQISPSTLIITNIPRSENLKSNHHPKIISVGRANEYGVVRGRKHTIYALNTNNYGLWYATLGAVIYLQHYENLDLISGFFRAFSFTNRRIFRIYEQNYFFGIVSSISFYFLTISCVVSTLMLIKKTKIKQIQEEQDEIIFMNM